MSAASDRYPQSSAVTATPTRPAFLLFLSAGLAAVHLKRFNYGGGMRGVPWWGVVSSAAAPVLMVGGWTVAASLQPRFDPVADTVSALAAQGAPDRWVMTLTFVLVGVCYVLTALALRPAGTAGRLILITGAVAGMLVAANPERAGDVYPWGHIIWASIGLAGVTAWPAGAWRRGSGVPWALRPDGSRRGRRGAARLGRVVRR